ncbi:MAG: TrkH family potassium uptake protein [Fusicatenibacter sp.]|nr:TrkH family potassium uptake protein [Fusicatenibacter sp.]
MFSLKYRAHHISPMKIIFFGYLLIIFAGTLLLCLPCATKGDGGTSLSDALFTATSATCVTGLIRFDTYTHWTLFGQLVILVLIQVGGLGFMTFAISLISLTNRKIGLNSRYIMQSSISAPQMGGIVRMTKFIVFGSLLFEGLGTLLLSFAFCPQYNLGKGLYFALFHAVSAFCNAGFDLMGAQSEFSSLTGYVGNWYVNLIIMILIVVGGLGFFVWQDLVQHKFHFRKLRLHSKIVLSTTITLILAGAVLFYLLELPGDSLDGMTVHEKILASLFQSVTARTAGFNTLDLSGCTESTQFLLIMLMMIGGSTGSTAGGIKTTTFLVLLFSIASTFRQKKSIELFGRRLEDGAIRTACCIFMSYLSVTLVVTLLISSVDHQPFLTSLFETVSAVGTVGLSLGITPTLCTLSKLLLAALMFFGRVGSLTILLAFTSDRRKQSSMLPVEKIQLG